MEINLNETIVNSVLARIPEGVKPIDCLTKLLALSRESVYRRLRSEIPFSVDELAKLALNLDFSMDEIIEGSNKERLFFDIPSKAPFNSSNDYISLFKDYNNYLQALTGSKKSQVIMALNEMPPLFSIFFDNLSKFSYYKWINNNTENSNQHSFSELSIPPELQSLREQIITNFKKITDALLILSPNVYLSSIKSIQYFYQRKLLTEDELRLIKNDVLSLINWGIKVVQHGFFASDSKVDIYLSPLYFNSSLLLLKYDENTEAHFWIYPDRPLIITSTEICIRQKKWLQTLKKQSTLITQSSEILQVDFFDKQYQYVEKYLVENEK
jgi:hypothetical protein